MNTNHTFTAPRFNTVVYTLNTSNNYYQVFTKPLGFDRLPDDLKLENTQDPKMREIAAQIIKGRTKEGQKLFFTGLRPAPDGTPNLYFGDDGYMKRPKKSFILFLFTPSQTQLTVYYFSDYEIVKGHREQFIKDFHHHAHA